MPRVTEPRRPGDSTSSDPTVLCKAPTGLRFSRDDGAPAALAWRARRREGD